MVFGEETVGMGGQTAVFITNAEGKLQDYRTYRFKGHGQPTDLAAVHSHCAMGELAREEIGFGEGVALRMEQRKN